MIIVVLISNNIYLITIIISNNIYLIITIIISNNIYLIITIIISNNIFLITITTIIITDNYHGYKLGGYYFGEKVYQILSLVAKSLLLWLVYGGSSQPDNYTNTSAN
jgi:hypothetical protein